MLRCLGRCAPRDDPGRGRTRRVGRRAPREAEPRLLRIRAWAARDTPDLYDALDAVRSAVRAVGVIARRPEERVPSRTPLLAAARAYALETAGFLATLLRTAEPDPKARVFGRR